jgi:hypothetical protein
MKRQKHHCDVWKFGPFWVGVSRSMLFLACSRSAKGIVAKMTARAGDPYRTSFLFHMKADELRKHYPLI